MPFANNNGVKIHYEIEGNGSPIVLHHGFGGVGERWRECGYTQELNKNNRVIALDARGCGKSDKPHDEKAYAFKEMVGDVTAILDDLKIEKANFFGYSMGGRVGFRIPIYAPKRFNSLILGGAAWPIKGTEDSEDDVLVGIKQDIEAAFKQEPERPIEYYLVLREKRLGPRTPAQRATTLANDPRALMASVDASLNMVSLKADEVLPRIKLPCLLFAGEADPRFPNVKECARRMPNAQFFSLPGLTHEQGLQRADLSLPHIKKFLAEVNRNTK